MTTPGGDIGEATAAETSAAAPRRGFDGVAVLAWIGAILFVIALPVLAIVAVVAIGSRQPEFAGQWAEIADVFSGKDEVLAAPLPGRPPRTWSDKAAKDRPKRRETDAPTVIANPSWVVRPAAEFPRLAYRQGVKAGRVELQCPVEADGTIPSCWILSETPAGAGFGQAAVNGAIRARLTPRTVDGVATNGMVRFAVNFRLG